MGQGWPLVAVQIALLFARLVVFHGGSQLIRRRNRTERSPVVRTLPLRRFVALSLSLASGVPWNACRGSGCGRSAGVCRLVALPKVATRLSIGAPLPRVIARRDLACQTLDIQI